MSASLLIWAAAGPGDWIGLVIFIVIVALNVIGALLKKLNQAQRPGGQPGQPAPPPRKAADPVAQEVEEFLRKAAQRRGGQAPPTQPQRPTLQELPRTPTIVREKPVAAQVAEEQPLGGRLSAHVDQYLDEQEFAQRSGKLGAEVVQADTEIAQHLHQTFDHQLGQFAGSSRPAARTPGAAAPIELTALPEVVPSRWAALLSDPESIQDAIVLNEILHRPVERWQ